MIDLNIIEKYALDEIHRDSPLAVISPYGMLTLVKIARAAQNAVNQGCLMHAAKGSIELIEALKEVEL
jgi:hypothetical protein